MVAESTTGAILSIQTASSPQGEGVSVIPEDLGKEAAEMLLEEIYRVCAALISHSHLGLWISTVAVNRAVALAGVFIINSTFSLVLSL